MKNIAIILSGCGVFDGAEIHESVLTLLALEKQGVQYQCFAPDIPQQHVVNHLTGEVEPHTQRNVLIESARIARGKIQPITELDVDAFDGLLLPGGFGVAKNLSSFAMKGAECQVEASVLAACRAFADAAKPAGYLCISPVLIPLIYGQDSAVTIGDDPETAAAIEAMGGKHINCSVTEIVVDKARKVISTPAYMKANSLLELEAGIQQLISQLLTLIEAE